ncbi:trans-sulfuration enzyme family protein [Psychroflexus montanilacus]|uniref:trans-sulfuration enzyme family protein n=1 Tax=Psychroflexus montanilacus TaxID=2873598 RepID=UPI001CCF92FA|nr:PLP-dependent aspartate aminotransferase family protein [Psychroflexus montanilacus]MBZ9653106.1 PLP-dependent aspartate aminotransferase family protein [Psychroflexus montanilacus]
MQKGLNTICVHTGEVEDKVFGGAVSPMYLSTAYEYDGLETSIYPRYFNSPNQHKLSEKIAELEKAESALIFGSGMAAITTAMLSVLRSGDHVILQNQIYGGTRNFIVEECQQYGIAYSFVDVNNWSELNSALQAETKLIYIETPSNPLLEITDVAAVTKFAKENNVLTMADNTFASPINQRPIEQGVDIVIHSATKYLGGHSDITAGAVASTHDIMKKVFSKAKNFGGSLADQTVWLLERSMKTLNLRVSQQSNNALVMAEFLENSEHVDKVYYPGLKSHPQHELAKSQMLGFGGMLSFDLNEKCDISRFFKGLKLIKNVLSLGGVESTVLSPEKTSHSLLTPEERKAQGIKSNLVRFSVGIEDTSDLKRDLRMAFSESL